MQADANQLPLALAYGVHRAPQNAPADVLRLIRSESHALQVSIKARHHKLAYIAAVIGKSVPYVSQMQTGQRAIPDRLVGPLCAATGSNLLKQYIDLQRALSGEGLGMCPVQLLRGAA